MQTVRKPVIAIFGTSDKSYKHYAASVALAETTAAALASKVVILSGASGTGDRGVKGAAARGAGSSYRIGIDKKGRTERLPSSSSKTVFQLSTNLGNGRNFLRLASVTPRSAFLVNMARRQRRSSPST